MALTRPLCETDYEDALRLYRVLVDPTPVIGGAEGRARFAEILSHPGTTIFGVEAAGRIAAIATLHILPNMTFGGRSYALIENVVTDADLQGQGLGRAVMQAAIEAAWDAEAYKIMLLTGRALGAKGFYEKLGFSGDEKHAMTLRRAPPRRS